MKTGLLLLTHTDLGCAFINTIEMILKCEIKQIECIEIDADDDIELKLKKIELTINQIDSGQGVLILSDLYGATPFNLAQKFTSDRVQVLSGLNLNMLLRAINYQDIPLTALARKAREGGINGIR